MATAFLRRPRIRGITTPLSGVARLPLAVAARDALAAMAAHGVEEHLGVEGLAEEGQADLPDVLARAGRREDDGDPGEGGVVPEVTQQLEAAQPGQADVEQYDARHERHTPEGSERRN